MASPLPTGKRSVNLAAPGVRGSRIRRNPPPTPVKEMSLAEREERDRRMAVIGIVAFALAIMIVTFGLSSFVVGWSPTQYTIDI